jgi:hypothetical protein
MAQIRITNFGGVVPRLGTKNLPDTNAQVSVNTKLYSGELRAWNRGRVVATESASVYDAPPLTSGDVRYEGRTLTFTPVLAGGTVAGTGTYTYQRGHYVMRDGWVEGTIELSWTAHTGTGGLRITGLPAPAVATRNPAVDVATSGVAATGVVGGYVSASTAYIELTDTPLGGARALLPVDAAGSLWVNFRYEYA